MICEKVYVKNKEKEKKKSRGLLTEHQNTLNAQVLINNNVRVLLLKLCISYNNTLILMLIIIIWRKRKENYPVEENSKILKE